jgi:ribosomal protein S25
MDGKTNIQNYYAFALSEKIKQSTRNGIWYNDQSIHKFLTKNNIKGNYRTNRRYLLILKASGAFKQCGKHLQLQNRNEVAKCLKIDHTFNENFYFNKILNQRDYNISEMTPVEAGRFILENCVMQEFIKQYHYVKKNISLLEQAKDISPATDNDPSKKQDNFKKISKSFMKQAKKLDITTEELADRVLSSEEIVNGSEIRTGCYHIAKKLGISHDTANDILNSLHKRGFIERKIERKISDLPPNNESVKYLKEKYSNNGIFILNNSKIIIILGSVIKLTCLL